MCMWGVTCCHMCMWGVTCCHMCMWGVTCCHMCMWRVTCCHMYMWGVTCGSQARHITNVVILNAVIIRMSSYVLSLESYIFKVYICFLPHGLGMRLVCTLLHVPLMFLSCVCNQKSTSVFSVPLKISKSDMQ